MLYAAENGRLEAVENLNHLLADTNNWATAYNNLALAPCKCSEKYSRLPAENISLRTQLQCINMQTSRQTNEIDRSLQEQTDTTSPKESLAPI